MILYLYIVRYGIRFIIGVHDLLGLCQVVHVYMLSINCEFVTIQWYE